MIVITGHLGFIGSYLTRLFDPSECKGIDLKEGNDILKMKKKDFPDANFVYHLAAQTSVLDSVADPFTDAENNILSTIRIAEIYAKARIIYTGSAGASQIIESPYGLSKRVAGEYLKLMHKNYVICNLSNVFGLGGKGVVEKFQSDSILSIYGDGNQTRDFIHIHDVVEGLFKASKWIKGEYNMGYGKPTKIIDLAIATRKPYELLSARSGEIYASEVYNTTPDWKPKIDVLSYMYARSNF